MLQRRQTDQPDPATQRALKNSQCATCVVRNKAVCGALSDDEREELGREGRTIQVKRGQTLLWEGEDALLVANVIEGVLKLSTSTSDGREQIVGCLLYTSRCV